jgi:hypothetical protein
VCEYIHKRNTFSTCICSNHDEVIICKLSRSRILEVRTKTSVWAAEHPTHTTCKCIFWRLKCFVLFDPKVGFFVIMLPKTRSELELSILSMTEYYISNMVGYFYKNQDLFTLPELLNSPPVAHHISFLCAFFGDSNVLFYLTQRLAFLLSCYRKLDLN